MKHLLLTLLLTISFSAHADMNDKFGSYNESDPIADGTWIASWLITPGYNTTFTIYTLAGDEDKAEMALLLEAQLEEYHLSDGAVIGSELALITEDQGLNEEDQAALMADIEAWINKNLPKEK